MKINELIKKIRLEHNYSFSEMGKRVGFSKGMISAVETERSPASKKLLESMIKNFPLYEDKLIKAYLEQFLPESIEGKVKVGDLEFKNNILTSANPWKVKVYNFISNNDGKVNLNEYEEIELVLDKEEKGRKD